MPSLKPLLECILPVQAAFGLMVMLVSGPLVAQPAQIIGSAEIVENRVSGEISGIRRQLAPEAEIYRSELIRTEAASSTRLRFSDRSDLRLGPSAQIRLDSAIYTGQAGTAVTLTRGALRFVSGNGPVGTYQIRTPVATIGLRGTTVDIVLRQGRAFVTLVDGAAQVCSGNRCASLTNRCDYIEAGGGQVSPARRLSPSIPTFSTACRGAACGGAGCTASATGTLGPAAAPPGGYDPAGGASSGAGGSGASAGGGKGR
ncbi:FecR family protein [Rhabdaerophilum sp. SD176]|uniref:FecR family protein n=1 Tax=Rhabdaerophilum sp. SD176 TaxID=2983548 RepID=UPI0024DF67D2|nr:FecR family protein [Rhabdaerophilum sp. SD176]